MEKCCFCGNLVKNDVKFSRVEVRFCSLECQIAAGKKIQYYLARKTAVEKESADIEEARKKRVVAFEEERRERSKAFEEERRKLTSVWQTQMNDALGNAMEWWFTLSDSQRLARVHEAANHLGPSQSVWCRAMAGCRRKELYIDDWSNEMREWYLLSEPQKLETLKQVVVDEEAWLLKIRELQQAQIAESVELIAKKNAFVQEQRKAKQEAVNLERLEQSQSWAVTWNNLRPVDQYIYQKNERELEELKKKIAKVAFREGSSGVYPSLHERINEIKQEQLIFQRDKKFIDEQAAQRVREAEEIRSRSREFGDLHKPQNKKKVASVEKAMSLLKKLTADMARVQKALKELNDK